MRVLLAGLSWLVAGHVALACPPPPQPWQPDIDRLFADDSAHPPRRAVWALALKPALA